MNKKETERLAIVETEIKNINDKIDIHTKEQREDFDKLYNKIDEIGNKFAGKWVEKGFWILLGTLISVAAGIVMII